MWSVWHERGKPSKDRELNEEDREKEVNRKFVSITKVLLVFYFTGGT
jgi:hypothetical protein